ANLRLSPMETVALALCRAVETDPMAGRALAFLQSPAGGARPTVGLVLTAVSSFDPAPPVALLAALLDGPARAAGLLILGAEARPLPENTLSTPLPLVLALDAIRSSWPGVETSLADPPPLPESQEAEAERHARVLSNRDQALIIRSRHPREARAAARLLAARLGAEPAFWSGDPPPGFGPWAWLTARVPVLCDEAAPGEQRELPRITGYTGPILVATGFDGT